MTQSGDVEIWRREAEAAVSPTHFFATRLYLAGEIAWELLKGIRRGKMAVGAETLPITFSLRMTMDELLPFISDDALMSHLAGEHLAHLRKLQCGSDARGSIQQQIDYIEEYFEDTGIFPDLTFSSVEDAGQAYDVQETRYNFAAAFIMDFAKRERPATPVTRRGTYVVVSNPLVEGRSDAVVEGAGCVRGTKRLAR